MARTHKQSGDDLLTVAGRKIAHKVCGGRCPVCRRKMSVHTTNRKNQLTMDHLHPCSKGGSDTQLVPLCGSCNSSKCDRELSQWLAARLMTVKRASTIMGARRIANKLCVQLPEMVQDLTAALKSEGIW